MIRVMSFNIRYGAADDGKNRWDHRKELAIARIRAFDPDLLGVQECQDDGQAEYLQSQLSAYQFQGARSEGDGWAGEMAPLLFKRPSFQEISRGHFWLSDTPDVVGSKSWDSAFARSATWAELRHKRSGRSVVFLNTHFDYQRQAIEESAKLLQQWIEGVVWKDPVIVTGDFNTNEDGPAYERLAGSGVLFDVSRQVPSGRNRAGTYHGYGTSEEPAPIDWILASEHFEAVAADVDTYHQGGLFPSDHYPVTAVLRWRKAER